VRLSGLLRICDGHAGDPCEVILFFICFFDLLVGFDAETKDQVHAFTPPQ
jgi:hypothetical protein